LAEIAGVFGNHAVSISSVIQKKALEKQAELVIITESVVEKDIYDAIEEIKCSPILKEVSSMIRVYTDED
jgi:homoserine dehydrogenase